MPTIRDNECSVDIEYVGGPDDGYRTVLVYVPGFSPEPNLDSFSSDNKTIYRYKRTDKKTKKGFLIYEYSGCLRR
jgi:hypothetical protein